MRTWPGRPYPLGATWDGSGVNFALFSENAERVELCLFDGPEARSESRRIRMREQTDLVWHCYLPDCLPGQLYGYRVHGPYDPRNGHRFNPNKVVLDPYAKMIGRDVQWDDALFGYKVGEDDLSFDDRDSAPFAPLAAVVDDAFTWGDDRPPRVPWHRTVIYEAHVRGMTMQMQNLPEKTAGSFAAMGSERVVEHLKSLGVTAVELLPVHDHLDDRHLLERGLSNYWGYNTLSFFAPEASYKSDLNTLGPVHEFKMMVRSLHSAGIEVLLDVVYNHTAEGSQLGPTLSWRGIDNAAYYRLADDRRYYMDFTGCGNTLNMQHPKVLQLIMDSLRYWVTEMHVDGFRFDLASTLARELFEVDRLGAFFDIMHQDPILSRVKLIAEPWDVGPGGYQVGNFPPGWVEWNGIYRDCVRKFWKGEPGLTGEFATRISGSSDLYEHSGRTPYASINFVTCHDGFTLEDLVSYDGKHNENNGDDNTDGPNDNESWNCGHEGPTDDPDVLVLRAKQKRNYIATLFFSEGVPMLCGGDELGRTQNGNNNGYCQDNPVTWCNWELNEEQEKFLGFVRKVSAIWKELPVFQRSKFFRGKTKHGKEDALWLNTLGEVKGMDSWNDPLDRCFALRLDGGLIGEADERGQPVTGDTVLMLVNSSPETVPFKLQRTNGENWELLLDTARPEEPTSQPEGGHAEYTLEGRSLALFRTPVDDSKKQVRDA